MAAKITDLSITFDDATVEKDFYDTLSKVNPQAMLDALGIAAEDVVNGTVTLTDEDKKSFVLFNFRAQIADTYDSTKNQQAVAALQRENTNKGKTLETDPLPKKVK